MTCVYDALAPRAVEVIDEASWQEGNRVTPRHLRWEYRKYESIVSACAEVHGLSADGRQLIWDYAEARLLYEASLRRLSPVVTAAQIETVYGGLAEQDRLNLTRAAQGRVGVPASFDLAEARLLAAGISREQLNEARFALRHLSDIQYTISNWRG